MPRTATPSSARSAVGPVRAQVGHAHLRARVDQQPDDVRADVAGALHGDVPAGRRRIAVHLPQDGADAREDADRGQSATGRPSRRRRRSTPVTHGVSSAIQFMSRSVAPTSSAAM